MFVRRQVAVEGEEWMVLAIDEYDSASFERKSSLQGNLYLKYVSLWKGFEA